MQMGEGISSEQSMQLIGQAADVGINFLDTAEMYPVPQIPSTQGASEKIIGDYLKTTKRCVSQGHARSLGKILRSPQQST